MVTPLESLKDKYLKDPDIIPEAGQDKEKLAEALAQQQIRQRKNNERAFELLTKAGSGEIADPGGGSKEGGSAAMYRLTEFVQKPVEKNSDLPDRYGPPTKKQLKIMNRPFQTLDKDAVDKIKLDPPPEDGGEIYQQEIKELKSLQELLENNDLKDKITLQDEKLFAPFTRYLRDNNLEVDTEELATINKDISTIVHKFKFFYNRPRPHQSSDIEEYENVAGKSPSYPSGHSTNSAVTAEILADKFPEHADNFRQIGKEIGLNRVIAGLHYPTDHIAGLKLAEQLIPLVIDKKVTKSDAFMDELFKYMAHREELFKDMTQIGTQDILDGVRIDKEDNPRVPRKKGQPAKSDKHSDLYTDEDPKGTITGLGFKDDATAKASVKKIKDSGRTHAHKIQAAVAMEQRAKAAGKSSEAGIYRKYINSMKEKTKRLEKHTEDEHVQEHNASDEYYPKASVDKSKKSLLDQINQIQSKLTTGDYQIEKFISKAKISPRKGQKKRREEYEALAEKLGLDIGNPQDQQDLQRETGMVIYGSPTEGQIFTPKEVEADQQKIKTDLDAKRAKREKQAIKDAKKAQKESAKIRDEAQAKIDADKEAEAKIERKETRQQKVSSMTSLNVNQSILNSIKNKFNRDFENVPDGKFKQDAEKHFTSTLVAALGKDKAFQQISSAKKLLSESKKTPTRFNTFLDNVRKDIDPNYTPAKEQEEIVEPDRKQKILDAWNYFQGEAQHHHKLEDETRAWGDLGDKANKDQKDKEKIITLNRDTEKRNIGLSNKKENYASDQVSDSLDSKFPVKILDMLGYDPNSGNIPLLGKRLRNSVEENTDKRATLHRFGQDQWSEKTMSKQEENDLIKAHESLAKNQAEKMTAEDMERNIGTYLKPPEKIRARGVDLTQDFLNQIETFDNLPKEAQDIILNNLEKKILANDGAGLTPGAMNKFLKNEFKVTDRGKRETYEFPSSVNSVEDQITAKVDFILDRLFSDDKYKKDLERYKLPNSLGLENINTNKDPLQWEDPNPKSEAGEILAKINLISGYKEKSELTSQAQELSNTFTDPNNTFEDLKNNNDITQSRSELQQIMKLHGMSTAEQNYFFKRHLPTENASVNDYIYAAGQLRNLLNTSEQFATNPESFKDIADQTYDMVDYKGKPEDIPVIKTPTAEDSDAGVSDVDYEKEVEAKAKAEAAKKQEEKQAIADAEAAKEKETTPEATTTNLDEVLGARNNIRVEAEKLALDPDRAATLQALSPEERMQKIEAEVAAAIQRGEYGNTEGLTEDVQKLLNDIKNENVTKIPKPTTTKTETSEVEESTGEIKILGGFKEFTGLIHVVAELPNGTKQHFGQQIKNGPFAPLKGFYLKEVTDSETGETKDRTHQANAYYEYNKSEANSLQGAASELDKAFEEGKINVGSGPYNYNNAMEATDFNRELDRIAGESIVPASTKMIIENPDLFKDKANFRKTIFENTPIVEQPKVEAEVEQEVKPEAESAEEVKPKAESVKEVKPETGAKTDDLDAVLDTHSEIVNNLYGMIHNPDVVSIDQFKDELKQEHKTASKLQNFISRQSGGTNKAKYDKFVASQATQQTTTGGQQPPAGTQPTTEETPESESVTSTADDVAKDIAQKITDMPTLFDANGNRTAIASNQAMASRYRQLRRLQTGNPVNEDGKTYVNQNGKVISRKDIDFAMRNVAPELKKVVDNQIQGLAKHLPKGILDKLKSEHTEGHENFQADYHGPEHKEKIAAEKQQSAANAIQIDTEGNEISKQGLSHEIFNNDTHKESHKLVEANDGEHAKFMDDNFGAGEWSKSQSDEERRKRGLPPERPSGVPATHLWHAASHHWVTPEYAKMHPDIGAALTNGEVVTGFEGTKDSQGNAFAIPHDAAAAAGGLAAIKTNNKDQGTGGGDIILTNANAPTNEHNDKTLDNVNYRADEESAKNNAKQAGYVENTVKNAQSTATDASRGYTRHSSGGNTALERYSSRFKAAGGFEGALARFKAAVLPDFAGGGFTQEQAARYSAPDYEKD